MDGLLVFDRNFWPTLKKKFYDEKADTFRWSNTFVHTAVID